MCQIFIYCKHVRRYIRPCFIFAPVLFLPFLFLPPCLFFACFIFAPVLFLPRFIFAPVLFLPPVLFSPLSIQATFSTWVCSNIYFPNVSWILFCHSDLMVGETNSLNLPEIFDNGEKGIEGNT